MKKSTKKKLTAAKHPIAAAIRAELLSALTTPLDIAALATIERVAKAGRTLLLATSTDVAQQIASTVPNASDEFGSSGAVYSMPNPMPNPMAMSPPAETFGVNALREIMAVFKKSLETKPKPATLPPAALPSPAMHVGLYELQAGIRDAKEAGDTALVARLERVLRKRMDAIDPPERLVKKIKRLDERERTRSVRIAAREDRIHGAHTSQQLIRRVGKAMIKHGKKAVSA